jgi:hypothetical protein
MDLFSEPALAMPPRAEIKDIGDRALENFTPTSKRGAPKKMRFELGLRTHEEAIALLIGKVNPFK